MDHIQRIGNISQKFTDPVSIGIRSFTGSAYIDK